ncbi:DNA damage-induced apoptosis suppressor protein isoform X3 [Felis catus]|uniref:DNA damage-induced apoptosis suppressor protein isoform X3 n=1 Tax=Felis catus TaxID=9685 RepID=UPI001D19E657|nr:DNA damage-induced apoptosis suppressor protein isoform X3 [Felis catus]
MKMVVPECSQNAVFNLHPLRRLLLIGSEGPRPKRHFLRKRTREIRFKALGWSLSPGGLRQRASPGQVSVLCLRSNCPKCGSTGKAENASYRYKLSLKVAESSKLFGITVFGSCLDAFFGLTATALHRYIQDHNETSETLDSDAIQNLLTKAVEICFIGQSFIFGVTNFGNQHGRGSDSSNFLKQRSDHRRENFTSYFSTLAL